MVGSHCRRATALAAKLLPLKAIQEAGAARAVGAVFSHTGDMMDYLL